MQRYLIITCAIVYRMRYYGGKFDRQIVVSKALRNLTTKFEHVVSAISEYNDLSIYTFDELMLSLLSHEDRLNRSHDKVQKKAFQVKGEFSYKGKLENSTCRGHGRRNIRGQGRGGGRGRNQLVQSRQYKSTIQSRYCKKLAIKKLIAG
uniref:Uncharacterized protein n=1 Tax=Solanum lycopersicum TaxID=4081 RepID=A0A3Q7IGA2_SOLLC